MRLAQLARQVGEKTFKVRETLSKEFDINFEKGPNTKLEENHVAFITELFENKEPEVLVPIVEEMVTVAVESAQEPKAVIVPAAAPEAPKEEEVIETEPVVEAEPVAEVVEAIQAEEIKVETTAEVAVDHSKMTVAELKAIAKEAGIKGISALKKADLIEAIKGSSKTSEPEKEAPSKIELPKEDRKDKGVTVGDILGQPKREFPDLPKPEDAELIKAPKATLEGFKVVDKIDLPEPKVKEVAEGEENDASEEKKESSSDRPKRQNNEPAKSRQPQHRYGPGTEEKKAKVKKKAKSDVKKGPSKQDFAKQKMEENYKPKPKQVKGKKKKAVQKQKVSEN
ncbi:MAG: hypothetical protein ACI9J3_000795, partial [Parvicellaceae bacterium]